MTIPFPVAEPHWGILQFLDADVAEAVDLPFLAVVLETDVPGGIGIVGVVGAEDAIHPDADAIAFGTDFVLVPTVAFEGALGLFAKGVARGRVVGFSGAEPAPSVFVVETARPRTVGGVDLGLIAKGSVGIDVATKEESRVGFAFGHLDFGFEDKVGVGFFRTKEKLFVSNKVDFALGDGGGSPFVGVGPAGERFPIEEVNPSAFVGIAGSASGKGGEKENGDIFFH